jgi:hypothetical protein
MRYFEKIDVKELKTKIKSYIAVDSDGYGSCNPKQITTIVENDLSKVNFDTENTEYKDPNCFKLIGYHTLSNGMPYLGVWSGGDWENAVFYIIYWDGKNLRGYIPEDGNCYNTTTKEAYGNDAEADLKNCKKRWPHINWPDSIDDFDDYVDMYDWKVVQKDIMLRIQEKPLSKSKNSGKVKSSLADFSDFELMAEMERRFGPRYGVNKNGE